MNGFAVILCAAVMGFAALAVNAQKPKYIGMKAAKAIALKEVPGTIKSSEMEKEHGKMIYSFDIKTADGSITEVNLDAVTGALIESKVETAADEAKEKAEDKNKKDKDKDD